MYIVMKKRGVYYSEGEECILRRGAYIIMKGRCVLSCQTDLDINVVHSTANSYNNSQSFEFFQVLKRFRLVILEA